MRPCTLDEFVRQEDLVGPGRLLRHAIVVMLVNRMPRHLSIVLDVTICLILVACTAQPAMPYVRLDNRSPLPAVSASHNIQIASLRVAVAVGVSPKGSAESYSLLIDYLSTRLGRPVEMVQRRTYAEIDNLLRSGQVEMAFVSSDAYVAGHRDYGLQLLAAPQVNGEAVERAYIVVPASSTAKSLADLQNKVFAFKDPMTYAGYGYPVSLVRNLGYSPERFFASTFFTYGYDDSIGDVVSGFADGAAVSSLIYNWAVERDPTLTRHVKVIQKSMPIAAPPAVVGPAEEKQLYIGLSRLLIELDQSKEGRAVLQAIGIDRFVLIDDSAYDSLREALAGYLP